MTEDHRERRLADSSKLLEMIDSLEKVKGNSRLLHVHDELMHAIDRSVNGGPTGTGKAPFTSAQMTIIKDIAFQIVYVLDPANRRPRGFFRAIWTEWLALSALTKIGSIVALIGTLGAAIVGGVKGWKEVEPMIWPSAPSSPTQPPPAPHINKTPTTPTTPPHSGPVSGPTDR